MTDFTPPGPEPITVKATATPLVLSETAKGVMIAGFAIAADRFLHSEAAIGVVLASSGALVAVVGALLTFFWGLWHRIRSWGALRFLASLAPDSVAVVGKPK